MAAVATLPVTRRHGDAHELGHVTARSGRAGAAEAPVLEGRDDDEVTALDQLRAPAGVLGLDLVLPVKACRHRPHGERQVRLGRSQRASPRVGLDDDVGRQDEQRVVVWLESGRTHGGQQRG